MARALFDMNELWRSRRSTFRLCSCSFASAAELVSDPQEREWKEFFRDPAQWLDHRNKISERWQNNPHFKHVVTGKGLWINPEQNPAWVQEKLGCLKEGSAYESIRAQYREEEHDIEGASSSSNRLVLKGSDQEVSSLLAELKKCSHSRDLRRGKELHSWAILSGNKYVLNSLINVYAKCGSMVDAQSVFDNMAFRDVVSWNSLLQGYVENGDNERVLSLFDAMESGRQSGCLPDSRSYLAAITACAALGAQDDGKLAEKRRWMEKGQAIHSSVEKNNCRCRFVGAALINMYANCGSMVEARRVFDGMVERDKVCWNALLQGYVENGESEMALELFAEMEEVGGDCSPDSRTYVAALMACAALGAEDDEKHSRWLEQGKALHSTAVITSCYDEFVRTALVKMYAKCGNMVQARQILEEKGSDTVTWTVLMQAYLHNGESEMVMRLYDALEAEGSAMDARTYVAALTACTSLAARTDKSDHKKQAQWLHRGKAIHSQAVRKGCCNMFVENMLIDLYAKCGKMVNARSLFESMVERSLVSWTSLIMGYVEDGENELALELIALMDLTGIGQDHVTFLAAVMACGNLMAMQRGKTFHSEIVSNGLEQNVVLANSLVDFYGKCGLMEAARQVFDSIQPKNIVSWTCLMAGYSLQGDTEQVFSAFDQMKHQGITPDAIVFTHLLAACSHAGLIELGKQHFEAMTIKYRISPDRTHYSCMIDLLARGNRLEEALQILKSIPFEAGVVAWTSLLAACRKWNNVLIGKLAYESLLRLDQDYLQAYVLMANIYGAAGMIEQQEEILSARTRTKTKTNADQSSMRGTTWWSDESGKLHKFVAGQDLPEVVLLKIQSLHNRNIEAWLM